MVFLGSEAEGSFGEVAFILKKVRMCGFTANEHSGKGWEDALRLNPSHIKGGRFGYATYGVGTSAGSKVCGTTDLRR